MWNIDDGSGGNDYPNNADCTWVFMAQDPSAATKITFTSYDLESGYDYARVFECYSELCTGSNRNEIYALDGSGSNFQLYGSTNILMVIFTTDTSVTTKSFYLCIFLIRGKKCLGCNNSAFFFLGADAVTSPARRTI